MASTLTLVGAPGGRGHRARPELIVDVRTEADAINAICLISGEWPHGNTFEHSFIYHKQS